jgi:serine protease Do
MVISVPRAARGAAGILILSCGLLASCTTASRRDPLSTTIVPPESPVSFNFDAQQLQREFEKISDQVAPAVVAIAATDQQGSTATRLHAEDINGDRLASMLSAVDRTVGTGFIVDSDGYILTNDHVVAGAGELWITTDDRKVYPAVIVESDPFADLALLKIPATHVPVAKLSDAPEPRRGQWTIALGNPYGLSTRGQMCASVGIISAVDQSLPRLSEKEDRLYSGLIQTTAQINPGNSGGPLIDLAGEVVGINTAVILPLKQANGIGFAIPVTQHLASEVENLKQGRQIVYAYLGVRVSSPTPHESDDAHLAEGHGVRIDSVEDSSPAMGKLLAGDIVLRFNNRDVESSQHFSRLVCDAPIDQPVTSQIRRAGHTLSIKLALRTRPDSSIAVAREKERCRWHGMLVGPIPANWDSAGNVRPSPGVLVLAVDPHSPLIRDGIRPGSIVTAVGNKSVCDVAQFRIAAEHCSDPSAELHLACSN